ncbi:alanine--glyoxylate aminotransferase 2, mitochondrial isoform X3 [Sitophilus oryzae]|uniref:Alanine--glyoxylate aminotransferase 2, mitochondrial n=1 Tax=Sitophilus oryzae TaxID=7048 RepID=A0A6J2YGS9_SITOR|nr:alanine--glyoxylate aminotransferase 2, mitochondrial isoform X3 [Sitophilus oryzae]
MTTPRMFLRNFATLPKQPKCDFIPKKYEGLSFKDIEAIRKRHLNPALTTYYSKPFAISQGHMQWLFDLDGKRYLDMFGGICTVSVGHCHPKITKAVAEQMEILGHCSNVYYNENISKYAKKLSEKLPGKLKVIYFVNSGSEANDLAVLLARNFTKNFNVMSLKNCYHGMTYQTMALTSNAHYKYPVPQNPGFFNTVNPDVYRGIWGGEKCRDGPVQTKRSCDCGNECEAGQKYIEQFQDEFKYTISKNGLAAFFAESIQGVGGTVQFPKNYIKNVSKIVKDNGGLFVADEVQTGFGRTGDYFWGFEGHNIEPDIVTMAKGIGNGYPLAAVATTEEIASSLTKASHFNTYGGNPIASTVGLSVLNIIEEENLQENSKTIGTHLLLRLSELMDEFDFVGDVRGKGLMIGVELVSDRNSRQPLSPEKMTKIWEACRDLGLIIGRGGLHGNVFRIKPPMCISKLDADFTVDVLRYALNRL